MRATTSILGEITTLIKEIDEKDKADKMKRKLFKQKKNSEWIGLQQ